MKIVISLLQIRKQGIIYSLNLRLMTLVFQRDTPFIFEKSSNPKYIFILVSISEPNWTFFGRTSHLSNPTWHFFCIVTPADAHPHPSLCLCWSRWPFRLFLSHTRAHLSQNRRWYFSLTTNIKYVSPTANIVGQKAFKSYITGPQNVVICGPEKSKKLRLLKCNKLSWKGWITNIKILLDWCLALVYLLPVFFIKCYWFLSPALFIANRLVRVLHFTLEAWRSFELRQKSDVSFCRWNSIFALHKICNPS